MRWIRTLPETLPVMYSSYSKLRLIQKTDQSFYVSFYFGANRYRFFDTKKLGTNITPNRTPSKDRLTLASEMLSEYRKALNSGWTPFKLEQDKTIYQRLLNISIPSHLSKKYRRDLKNTLLTFISHLKSYRLENERSFANLHVKEFLTRYDYSASVFNHERKRLNTLFTYVLNPSDLNPISSIRRMKEKQELHKPFKDVNEVFEEIKSYNEKLYLCCLLTYGCLLRPHQEIRNLRWSDLWGSLQGSLVKLHQVMGHSDLKVTLTYLRGLEVQSLDVEDMPSL